MLGKLREAQSILAVSGYFAAARDLFYSASS